MKNKKINQHYVQVAFLSNYAINPTAERKDLEIWYLKRKEKIPKKIKLNNIAFAKSFLTDEADDLITEMEISCSPSLKNILQEKSILPYKLDLYRYFAYQTIRTIHWRKLMGLFDIISPNKKARKVRLKEIQSEQFTKKNIDNPFPTQTPSDEYYEQLDKKITAVDKKVGELLNETIPIFVINETSQNFITNDAPAAYFYAVPVIKLESPEISFNLPCVSLFPLTPKHLILFGDRKTIEEKLGEDSNNSDIQVNFTDEGMIYLCNERMSESCHLFLFANSESDLGLISDYLLKKNLA